VTPAFEQDVVKAIECLRNIEREWEGRASIMKLKDADYNWRQMEWWGFYFEWLCFPNLRNAGFEIPGEQFASTVFDARRSINWDLKAHAIKTHSHKAILNDVSATKASIKLHGSHGIMIAVCDVTYNDINRTFQTWHTALKGGHSPYEIGRINRTSVSRYRKTHASLVEIIFVELTSGNIDRLSTYRQGRNSNGQPRPHKYMIDIDDLPDDCFLTLRF